MGGESSKSTGGDGRAGRRRSDEAINAVFASHVRHLMCNCGQSLFS